MSTLENDLSTLDKTSKTCNHAGEHTEHTEHTSISYAREKKNARITRWMCVRAHFFSPLIEICFLLCSLGSARFKLLRPADFGQNGNCAQQGVLTGLGTV